MAPSIPSSADRGPWRRYFVRLLPYLSEKGFFLPFSVKGCASSYIYNQRALLAKVNICEGNKRESGKWGWLSKGD
jgi:hypothetical protein